MRGPKGYATVLSAALLMMAGTGAGMVAANAADSGDVYSACLTPNGLLRAVTQSPADPVDCKEQGWTAVSWNTAGVPGAPGAPGSPGDDGRSLEWGAGKPLAAMGNDGDTYLDVNTWRLFGPKKNGAWGPPTSILQEFGGEVELPNETCDDEDEAVYGIEDGQLLCGDVDDVIGLPELDFIMCMIATLGNFALCSGLGDR